MTASIGVQLGQRRLARQIPRTAVARRLNVRAATVRTWDTDRNSPTIQHAAAYARLVGARLVLRQNLLVVADALEVPDRLAELREAAGMSQGRLDELLVVSRNTTSDFERHAGPTSYVDTVARYVAPLGYELALIPGGRAYRPRRKGRLIRSRERELVAAS